MKFETFQFNCLSVFASALIYGDESALTELESEILEEWQEKLYAEFPGAVMSIGEESEEFANCFITGLPGTLINVIVSYPVYMSA